MILDTAINNIEDFAKKIVRRLQILECPRKPSYHIKRDPFEGDIYLVVKKVYTANDAKHYQEQLAYISQEVAKLSKDLNTEIFWVDNILESQSFSFRVLTSSYKVGGFQVNTLQIESDWFL